MYIMASLSGVLYVGMTNNLFRRVQEHKDGEREGFTKDYRVRKLVYYEVFDRPRDAITREKEVKGWRRARKIALIESVNATWRDLTFE
jgi:putative endonuclease